MMHVSNGIRRPALVAGAFVLAAALPATAEPVFGPTPLVKTELGLVLPWGAGSQIVLSLKNGSHAFRRLVKVHFCDPAGQWVAASERFALGPRASRSATVEELIETGSWTEGSVEIFYAGQDGARLLATAALADPARAIPGLLVLPHAGVRHHVDAPRLPPHA